MPVSVKREHPEIAWKRMTGMRDKLIHEYFGVDLQIIWDTTKIDFATSKPLLEQLLKK
ncbi:MAG: HepT-like ribonuclease domain-containing protein [Candidatus Bathyarchaeia archaeon]